MNIYISLDHWICWECFIFLCTVVDGLIKIGLIMSIQVLCRFLSLHSLVLWSELDVLWGKLPVYATLCHSPLQGLLLVGRTRGQKTTQRMKRRDFWSLWSFTCDVPWTLSCFPRWWWSLPIDITVLEAGRLKAGSQILFEKGKVPTLRHCRLSHCLDTRIPRSVSDICN